MNTHTSAVAHIASHLNTAANATHTSFYNSGAPLLIALGLLVLVMIWPGKRRRRG